MRTKPALTDEDVKKMAAAAQAHAVANNWHVTIAICDDGGHLLHLHRMDGTPPGTVDMALGKGRTAVFGGRETKVYEDVIKNGRVAFLSAPLARRQYAATRFCKAAATSASCTTAKPTSYAPRD